MIFLRNLIFKQTSNFLINDKNTDDIKESYINFDEKILKNFDFFTKNSTTNNILNNAFNNTATNIEKLQIIEKNPQNYSLKKPNQNFSNIFEKIKKNEELNINKKLEIEIKDEKYKPIQNPLKVLLRIPQKITKKCLKEKTPVIIQTSNNDEFISNISLNFYDKNGYQIYKSLSKVLCIFCI